MSTSELISKTSRPAAEYLIAQPLANKKPGLKPPFQLNLDLKRDLYQ